MELNEQVSYIKGLVEGSELDLETKEGKVLAAILDLLDDMALTVTELDDENNEIWDVIDEIDEDLGDLEDDYANGGRCHCESDHCPCMDHECDCGCMDDDDEFTYEVVCPSCGEHVCVFEDMLDEGEIECPNCGENLEFDFDFDEGEDEKSEDE